jgi:hypothetical protein
MADGALSSAILADFAESGTGGPVANCCNDVQGEWERAPGAILAPDIFIDGVPEPLGDLQVAPTYYLDTIPKGLSFSYKFRYRLSIRGTLVCKCGDDGRTMSSTPFDKKTTIDVQTPVGSVKVVRLPILGWIGMAIDAYKMGKQLYELYDMTPEKLRELAGDAVEAVLKEIRDSADTLCRLKHKPCSSPSGPGIPTDPIPVDPVPGPPLLS